MQQLLQHSCMHVPVPNMNASVDSPGVSATAMMPPMLVDKPASSDSATGHTISSLLRSAAMSSCTVRVLSAAQAAPAPKRFKCRAVCAAAEHRLPLMLLSTSNPTPCAVSAMTE